VGMWPENDGAAREPDGVALLFKRRFFCPRLSRRWMSRLKGRATSGGHRRQTDDGAHTKADARTVEALARDLRIQPLRSTSLGVP